MAPHAKITEAERRADLARFLFDCEKALHDKGAGGHPLLFFDVPRDLFRFGDGSFALSREHAGSRPLKEAGFFSE